MDDLYKQIANLPPEKRELFELMLMEQGVDLSKIMIVPQNRDTNRFTLSYSQQRLWFLDQLQPGSALYNIASVIRIKGHLNVSALEKSFNEVIRRHEVLRTTFDKDGDQPVQVITGYMPLQIKIIDRSKISPLSINEEIINLANAEAQTPFNLQTGPLLRASLVTFSEIDSVLLVTMHHIVSDNWSTGLFVHEIIRLYETFSQGLPSPLPELAVQYADFSIWQRKWLKGKTLENQINYWREQLQDALPLLDMPLDYARPSFQTYNGDYLIFQFPKEIQDQLNALSRNQDVTIFMTLLSAFYVLLFRYSGQDDICVGTPIANRNRKETETLIGFFVNTLVLRVNLSGNPPFWEVLKRVKETTLGAYAHQDLPFETLVEELQPERNISHSPFFQVMFVLNNAPVQSLRMSGLELSLIEIENKTSKFDLILNAMETSDGLSVKLEFNTDLYSHTTMRRFLNHLQNLINAIIRNPEMTIADIPILTTQEEKTLLHDWNRSPKHYDDSRTIVQMFEEQAEKSPQAIALRVKNQSMTYRELNENANQLAGYLLQNGLKPGDIVGICAGRSPEMIVGLMSALKAGGVYLPLDPNYPPERLAYMLNDSAAPFLLTQQNLLPDLPEHQAQVICLDSDWHKLNAPSLTATAPATHPSPDQPAYIIYTSGSTGQPKGVVVQHKTIANHCLDMRDFYELTSDDRVLQFAALNFDASIEQILPPLISGATVVMRDDEIWDISLFHEKIKEYELTVINPPTAYWAQLAREWVKHPDWATGHNIRLVIIGGDILNLDVLKLWQQTPMNHVRLLNAYGPTETTITATTFEIPPDFTKKTRLSRVPIGRQRANREVYVLDRHGQPAPIGVPGELHIGGDALAEGYLNRPELTAERFISNPFIDDWRLTIDDLSVSNSVQPQSTINNQQSTINNRLYKTGDLVRFLPDGNLDFLGRVDQQVKIRGFRIELGEIEALLNQHSAIAQAVVAARAEASGENRLVAYYVSKDGAAPSMNDLRSFLKAKLPDYMIPAAFMALDKMPADPSGKINRRALPQPEQDQLRPAVEFVAPRTPTEEKLADIVKEVLNISQVGVYDNFFELGGHSMMATQVVSRIREAFAVSVQLRALFERPTVEGIAQSITEQQASLQDDAELEKMLSELEGISDEEAQRLLQDES